MDLVTAPPDHAGIGCPRQRAALATFSSYALGDPDLDELRRDVAPDAVLDRIAESKETKHD